MTTKELARQIGQFMSEISANQSADPPGIDVTPSDLAVISYTSGTTGRPRGVCLTHRNLVANALQTRHWMKEIVYGKEVVLAVVPFEHSYGMTAAMNLPILIAAKIVIISVFELKQVLGADPPLQADALPGRTLHVHAHQSGEKRAQLRTVIDKGLHQRRGAPAG